MRCYTFKMHSLEIAPQMQAMELVIVNGYQWMVMNFYVPQKCICVNESEDNTKILVGPGGLHP